MRLLCRLATPGDTGPEETQDGCGPGYMPAKTPPFRLADLPGGQRKWRSRPEAACRPREKRTFANAPFSVTAVTAGSLVDQRRQRPVC